MDFQEFSGLQNDGDGVIHLWTIDVLIGSLDNSDDDDFVVVHLSHQHRHPLLPGWVVGRSPCGSPYLCVVVGGWLDLLGLSKLVVAN